MTKVQRSAIEAIKRLLNKVVWITEKDIWRTLMRTSQLN